jgi:diacylglycerol kinase (ATP)
VIERPEKQHGIGHFLAAARYSMGGVRRLWGETAFRHETLAFVIIMALFIYEGVAAWAYVGAVILYLLTASIEALNTAVEEMVDHVSPGYSEMGKHAKDLGSFAVFCLLLANGVWAAFVLAASWGWISG